MRELGRGLTAIGDNDGGRALDGFSQACVGGRASLRSVWAAARAHRADGDRRGRRLRDAYGHACSG